MISFKYSGRDIYFQFQDEIIEAHMKQYKNFYEHWMLEAKKDIKGRVIDIGANFGNHTVFYSLYGGAHEVIAIEPIWENYRNLCYNIELNRCPNVKPVWGGISDEKGWMGSEKKGRWSQCTLNGEGNIPVFPIDTLSLDNVKLIKIDCEGMEEKALKGAMKTIELNKPDIFIESFEGPEWVSEILNPLGYILKERYNEAPTYHFSV